ncbi:MAG: M56 family metallopeptidase [Gemmataceae bacterium]
MRELLLDAATWCLGTALGGSAILLAGCALMRVARQPAVRQRVGEWAVLAALAVAALRLGPSWLTLPALRSAEPAALSVTALTESVNGGAAAEMADAEWVFVPVPTVDTAALEPAVQPQPPEPWDWRPWVATLTGVYLAVVAILTGRWLLGQWALRRLWRQARPARGRVRRLFAVMAGSVWPRPGLRLSGRLRVPVAFGLRKPAVVLPAAMSTTANADELRWVFAHELTHIRRHDPWSYWALGLAQAVYFYVPWFWWLKRQVRLCQEYVADAAAAGEQAGDYAAYLVSLAKMPPAPLGAAGLGNPSDLYRRVSMLLESSSRVQGHCPRRWSLLAAGALVPAAVLFSGLTLRADPPADKTSGTKDVFILRDESPTLHNVVFRLVDEQEDKKDEKKKDEKKSTEKTEKKGTIRIEIDLDGANPADIHKQIEAALEKIKKQFADSAKGTEKLEAAGKMKAELARKLEVDARQHAEEAKKQAEAARAMAEKIKKEVEEKVKAGQFGGGGAGFGGFGGQGGSGLGGGGFGGGGFAVARKIGSGRLGVSVDKPSAALADQLDLSKDQGLLITDVVKASAAAKAGLKANDILLQFAGKDVTSSTGEFTKLVASLKGDDKVDAVVLRKGKKERIKGIELPEAKKDDEKKEARDGVWEFKPGEGGKVIVHEVNPAIIDGKKIIVEGVKPGEGKAEFKIISPNIEVLTPKAGKVEAGSGSGAKGKSATTSVSVEVKDGELKATMKEGEATITVRGKVDGGKVAVREITIDEGSEKAGYKSIDDVPEKYRSKVKKLIANGEDSPVRFRFSHEAK